MRTVTMRAASMKSCFLRRALTVLLCAGVPLANSQAAPSPPAPGQAVTAAQAADEPVAAFVLEPFVGQYRVLRAGRELGEATLRLRALDGPRWQVDLNMRGTGLIGLAGINAEQSTIFDQQGETYRPLSQSTVRKALFTRRQITGTYDWSNASAQWQGDIKKTRRAPVLLRPGDMSGLLINLAVVRDARPGASLDYRFVDNGRTRDHHYQVAPELESVAVADMDYNAMRVTRVQGGNEETVIWVVKGVPTPVRILQREDGQDTYDLRLTEYTGVP